MEYETECSALKTFLSLGPIRRLSVGYGLVCQLIGDWD